MIDARGYSCPEPVMMLRKAMFTKEDSYEILVDNRISVENLTGHNGYDTECKEEGEDFHLFIRKNEGK